MFVMKSRNHQQYLETLTLFEQLQAKFPGFISELQGYPAEYRITAQLWGEAQPLHFIAKGGKVGVYLDTASPIHLSASSVLELRLQQFLESGHARSVPPEPHRRALQPDDGLGY